MKKLFFPLLVLFSAVINAQDFQNLVAEIAKRLDQAQQLHQAQEYSQAQAMIKSAYFEIFENLEGAIRTNVSAKKNYQLEKSFWEIHDLIKENGEIQEKISQLKSDLNQILPELKKPLKAEKTVNLENKAEKWQKIFKQIDDNLALAINNYQSKNFSETIKIIQDTQFQAYKNSELETTIRLNKSAKEAAKINQYFYNLIKLAKKENQLQEFAYQTTNLLQDLEPLLENLPVKEEKTHELAEKNWQEIKNNLEEKLALSLNFLKDNNQGAANFNLEAAYFDFYQDSGLEEKIYNLDRNKKNQIDILFQKSSEAIKKGNFLELENNFRELKTLLNF